MNLSQLPKEIQILISEFNPEHRPKMRKVFKELREYISLVSMKYSQCGNCFDTGEQPIITYIYWQKYVFCSEWCHYDLESYIRKHSNYRVKTSRTTRT